MKENFETVKGFKDFIGAEAQKREKIRALLVETFEKYGFEPVECPIVEYKDFVIGNNSNDEAVSDVFKLKDRGMRELALRYEMTFQLKRYTKGMKLPYKRYVIGPVFRDEPTGASRLRQFTQADVDIIGSKIDDEAEILAITKRVLESLGIEFVIYVNNRKLLNEILEKNNIEKKDFDNVIREIDKLDKLERKEVKNNLKKYNAEKILDVFDNFDSSIYENYKEVEELIKLSRNYNVKVEFSPSLARGLSYYNGNVFEVKSKEMKETITAGGSFMFNNVQCTGISFGLDRLSFLANIDGKNDYVMILSVGEPYESVKIAEKLRDDGKKCFLFFDKIRKGLEYANAKGIKKVVIVGSDEIKVGKIKIKNLESGKEELIDVDKIVKYI